MFCPECGKEIDKTNRFCPYCAAKNEYYEPAPQAPAPANMTESFLAERQAQKASAPAQVPVASAKKGEYHAPVSSAPQAFAQPNPPQAPYSEQPAPAYAPQPPAPSPKAKGAYIPPVGSDVNPAPQAKPAVNQPMGEGGQMPPITVKPKKKNFPAWAIVLIVLGVLLVVGTLTGVYIIKKVLPAFHDTVQSQIDKDLDDIVSEFDSMSPNADNEKDEVDFSNVGKPKASDFSWYSGVPQGFPAGSKQLTKAKDIAGKWKAYYVIDGGVVKELCNMEFAIGSDDSVTITVDPYMTNYDNTEWEYESGVNPYSYDPAKMDTGSLTAMSDLYGTLIVFGFHEHDGVQYGFGSTMLQSGETVEIALVRP